MRENVSKYPLFFALCLLFIYGYIITYIYSNYSNEAFFILREPISWVEVISAIIFFSTLILSVFRPQYYVSLLIFNILAMPSAVNNLLPSIQISALGDFREVYFPLFTNIDIFLIIGILRFWREKNLKRISFDFYYWKHFTVIFFLIFIPILYHLINEVEIWNVGIILSHSYHFRYFFLLFLIINLVNVQNLETQIFYGIALSVGFLITEAIIYTHVIRNHHRLLSGSLRNNSFANILIGIFIYNYCLVKKRIFKNIGIILLFVLFITILLTGTRSAMFLLFLFLFGAILIEIIKNKRKHKKFLFGIFLIFFLIFGVYKITTSKRLDIREFDITINTDSEDSKEFIQIKKTDFNYSLILRLLNYQASVKMIIDKPYFGIGPGTWNKVKSSYGLENKQLMDAHNDYLAVSSQYGILSGIFLVTFIGVFPLFIVYNVKEYKKAKGKVNILKYLFVINFTIMITGISNATFFKYQIYSFLCFNLLVLSLYAKNLQQRKNKSLI